MIKEHPIYGNIEVNDNLLSTIVKHIENKQGAFQFSWHGDYTRFETIIVPIVKNIHGTGFLLSGRFLFCLLEFNTFWHFTLEGNYYGPYIEEKMKINRYDAESIAIFLNMLNEISKYENVG